jgi:hypothetical protein
MGQQTFKEEEADPEGHDSLSVERGWGRRDELAEGQNLPEQEHTTINLNHSCVPEPGGIDNLQRYALRQKSPSLYYVRVVLSLGNMRLPPKWKA